MIARLHVCAVGASIPDGSEDNDKSEVTSADRQSLKLNVLSDDEQINGHRELLPMSQMQKTKKKDIRRMTCSRSCRSPRNDE